MGNGYAATISWMHREDFVLLLSECARWRISDGEVARWLGTTQEQVHSWRYRTGLPAAAQLPPMIDLLSCELKARGWAA